MRKAERRKRIAAAAVLYEQGWTVRILAELMRAKPSAVRYWLRSLGVQLRDEPVRRKRRARRLLPSAIALHQQGWSVEALAVMLRERPQVVAEMLREGDNTIRSVAE